MPILVVVAVSLGSCTTTTADDAAPLNTQAAPSVTVSETDGAEDAPPTEDAKVDEGAAADDEVDRIDLIERAELIADMVIASFSDETTALVAVLLSLDRGYSIEQAVSAALDGRLLDDGVALTDEGDLEVPLAQPLELFIETADTTIRPASFARAPLRDGPTSVSPVTEALRASGSRVGLGGLILLLMLVDTGYSLEQIVLAMLSNSDVGAFAGRVVILDDGRVLTPAQPHGAGWLIEFGDMYGDRFLGDRPATETSETPAADTDERGVHELVRAAEGVYRLTGDLEALLLTYPDTIRVNYTVGQMTVAADGTVSGRLEYSHTYFFEEFLNEPSFELTYTHEITVPATPLMVVDDGLRFSPDVMWTFCEDSDCNTFDTRLTGFIDPDLGILVMGPLTTRGSGDVVFQR